MGVFVGVGVRVDVGLGVSVAVDVRVGPGVPVGSGVWVGVLVCIIGLVTVAVGDTVTVGETNSGIPVCVSFSTTRSAPQAVKMIAPTIASITIIICQIGQWRFSTILPLVI
jgi:hypothetical protein